MKLLLFAAFALSLILVVSAQCDFNALFTCGLRYANMVSTLYTCRLTAVCSYTLADLIYSPIIQFFNSQNFCLLFFFKAVLFFIHQNHHPLFSALADKVPILNLN